MSNVPRLLCVALAFGLAACRAGGPSPDAPSPNAPVDGPESSTADAPRDRPGDYVIQGEATYRERIRTPPGASLDVRLVDMASPGSAIASTTVRDIAGPPIPFALPYAQGRVRADGRYGLAATIRGPDGEQWFVTPSPVAVIPGEGVPVALLLNRASRTAAAADTNPSALPPAYWKCGDLAVTSRYGDNDVRLSYGAHELTLPIAMSASGARYADARGNEFWTKGPTGTLTLAGDPPRDCVETTP